MDKMIAKMISQAHAVLNHAYAPYSKFSVACCIYTEQGHFYTGVNVENASFGLTSCAETSAIGSMISAGEQKIKSMVVLAGNDQLCSPCGACRQRIHEFSTSETLIHLCNKDTVFHSMTVDELLPLAFNFKL
ncbi:cytidine deaminase [Legionella shakespearei]|uniref:Cytidine deaminase n=1 Tax=Legionella shakespearei DSM 23087 TaxID=1122169 RepID=A0A0W0YV52_9GAMM|nr:cytidine deaminase [Legionella shakespearei]KTD60526.1 cytidine deaminase [Legionella shakespearei DSM 23087]